MIKETFQSLYDAVLTANEAGIRTQVFFVDTKDAENKKTQDGTLSVVNVLSRDREDTKASGSRVALVCDGKVIEDAVRGDMQTTRRSVPTVDDCKFKPSFVISILQKEVAALPAKAEPKKSRFVKTVKATAKAAVPSRKVTLRKIKLAVS